MTVESFESQGGGGGTTRWVIIGVVAVVVAAGAFFAGKAMAGGGPATLAEAVQQARAGDLPCGDTGAALPTPPAGQAPPTGAPGAGGGGGFALRAICDGNAGQPSNGNGQRRFGGFGQVGQVVSLDGSTLTIRGQQGNTTVKLGANTSITRSTKASTADLKPGVQVIVAAPPQGGTARSVQIIPSATGSN